MSTTKFVVSATNSSDVHFEMIGKIKQRNPDSINPSFWTPDSVTKHQAWHRCHGLIESQGIEIKDIENNGDAILSEAYLAFLAFSEKPQFIEFLLECDDLCLREKNGDWTDAARLFVAWPEVQITVALDINRTTIEGGFPVVEYVMRVVKDEECEGGRIFNAELVQLAYNIEVHKKNGTLQNAIRAALRHAGL